MSQISPRVYRRTFEAEQHPKGSPERARLNLHSETSEYNHSYKYGAEGPNFRFTFRTRREAEAYVNKLKGL